MTSLAVIVGSPGITACSDITRRLTGLTFSNVDPGGFEIASITIGSIASGVRPNAEVRIMLGCEIAWHGRINAIGEDDAETAASYTLECVGYGAVLSDFQTFSYIIVDRDLSQWGSISGSRKTGLQAFSVDAGDAPSVLPDTTAVPSLDFNYTAPIGRQINIESLYDAGIGNNIGSFYYAWTTGAAIGTADANWQIQTWISSDDKLTTTDTATHSPLGASGSNTLSGTGGTKRYASISVDYKIANAASGTKYHVYMQAAVYGAHGITKRGSAPQGFYPADIATWLISSANNTFKWSQVIDTDPLNYILYHCVYRTTVEPEQVVDDMANLLGWHWGVWEPLNIGSTQPTFYFKARPASPTFVVRRGALAQLSAPKLQLDQLISSVIVNYTDPAGVTGSVTVTVANPFLDEAGLTRTITADGGLMGGGSTEATAYGNMLLALAQAAARGSGSAIMPGNVKLPNGQAKPSALLKAGRDRVRINDLPDAGPFDVADSRRFDTFRVKRVESTLQGDGTLQTRLEFDGGADLMEVLTARLNVAEVLAGV